MYKKLENNKPKICFVSLLAYPLLRKNNIGYFGGAEVQQVEIAKELSKRGYPITFITYNEENEKIEEIDGIKIIPVYSKDDVNKINFLTKTLIIWKNMKKVNADIYIHRSGAAGVVGLFCLLNGKKTITFIASDAKVAFERSNKNKTSIKLFTLIGSLLDIKLSNIVVVQNRYQQNVLKNRFRVNSLLIKNVINIPPTIEKKSKEKYVLWVGEIRPVKQADIFLRLAQEIPKVKFILIGGKEYNSSFYKELQNYANNISNVDFLGFIPYHEIDKYFEQASLFVNTSQIEGFPNTFLQAWVGYTPVVSLNVDPDGIISNNKLGFHSKTYGKMVEDVKTLLGDDKLREELGINGRKYVEEEHDINKIVIKYTELFGKLVKNTKQ
jgi:glycosyltransferase involved in cell wall biosynthesis